MPRDPKLSEIRRRQITNATIACIRRKGFHQSSVQEICREADISAGALYKYFPSKIDMLTAVIRDQLERSTHFMDDIDDVAPQQALATLAWRHLDLYIEDRALMLEILSEASRNEAIEHAIALARAERVAVISSAIAQTRAVRETEDYVDPKKTARLLLAALDGIGLQLALGGINSKHEAVRRYGDLIRSVFASAGLRNFSRTHLQ